MKHNIWLASVLRVIKREIPDFNESPSRKDQVFLRSISGFLTCRRSFSRKPKVPNHIRLMFVSSISQGANRV